MSSDGEGRRRPSWLKLAEECEKVAEVYEHVVERASSSNEAARHQQLAQLWRLKAADFRQRAIEDEPLRNQLQDYP